MQRMHSSFWSSSRSKEVGQSSAQAAAVGAEPVRDPAEGGKTGDKTEQCPEGAEIAAPVAGLVALQPDDRDEDERRQKGQRIERLPVREQIVLQKPVAGIEQVAAVPDETVEPDPAGAGGLAEEGMEKERERPDQDGDGVEEPGQVQFEQGRREQRQEQPVFDVSLEPADRG